MKVLSSINFDNIDCFGAFSDGEYVDPVVAANAQAQQDPNYYAPVTGIYDTTSSILPGLIASTISNKTNSKNLATSLKAAGKYVKSIGQSAAKVKAKSGGLQAVNTQSGSSANVMPILLLVGGGIGLLGLIVIMSRRTPAQTTKTKK